MVGAGRGTAEGVEGTEVESDDSASADPAEPRLAFVALHVVAAGDSFDRDPASWTILKLLSLFEVGEILTTVDEADGEGMRRQTALRAVALPTGGAADRAPPEGLPAERPAAWLGTLGVGARIKLLPPRGFISQNFELFEIGKLQNLREVAGRETLAASFAGTFELRGKIGHLDLEVGQQAAAAELVGRASGLELRAGEVGSADLAEIVHRLLQLAGKVTHVDLLSRFC